MKTIQARYPGRCIRTGAVIRPGDSIIWHGRGRAELIGADTIPSELAAVAELAALVACVVAMPACVVAVLAFVAAF